MQYIVWTMTEDEELLYVGNVEWDSMNVTWTANEDEAGVFFPEEVDELEDLYDYIEAEVV